MKRGSKTWTVFLALSFLALGAVLSQYEVESDTHLQVTPRYGIFRVNVTTTGSLRAKNATNILGPSSARYARIFEAKVQHIVAEGTIVKKGDFVAELDKSELITKIEDAHSNLQQLESELIQTQLDTALILSKARDHLVQLAAKAEMAKTLKSESIYEAKSVQRQADIDLRDARSALELERKNFSTTEQQSLITAQRVKALVQKAEQYFQNLLALEEDFTILAPADGMVIYKRDVQGSVLATGDMFNAWDPIIATLPDFSIMESVTYVNEIDIEKIKIGQKVEVGLDAQRDKTLRGQVAKIANIGEKMAGSSGTFFQVVVEIKDQDDTIRPVMTTSNVIIVEEEDNVLSIPLECIRSIDSTSYVVVEQDYKIIRQEITLGLINENEAQVLSGLDTTKKVFLTIPLYLDELSFIRLD